MYLIKTSNSTLGNTFFSANFQLAISTPCATMHKN